ncbi:MAG: CoA-binding protein [Polyangiaceae bacterium]|nr:CoA-binding protein [Polyangiaceae bacterium]
MILVDEAAIATFLRSIRTVAVLGIKTEAQREQPGYYVPEALQRAGLKIVPVPVYYPNVTEILGEKVYRTLAAIPEAVDLVDVFRRPEDIDEHIEDILAKKPRGVWFQSGIRNDVAAERLSQAGITVVQDRCLMVDHQRYVK